VQVAYREERNVQKHCGCVAETALHYAMHKGLILVL